MTPTLDDRFANLRAAADAVARTVSEVHIKDLDLRVAGSYPAATVIKLERHATVEFRAGLDLLGDPLFAYSAEILLRSVLEADAQLWRIYGMKRASVASRRRRAICFEFGAIRGLYRSIQPQKDKAGHRRQSRLMYSTAEGRSSIRKRYKQIAALHLASCGPTCPGTSYSGLDKTLSIMSKRYRSLRWVLPMYEISSMASHEALQRGLAAADQSTMAVVPMDLPERAAMYDRLLTAYAQGVEIAAQIHMPELEAFRGAALALKHELTALYTTA